MIEGYTREAGVRELQRQIGAHLPEVGRWRWPATRPKDAPKRARVDRKGIRRARA